MYVYDMCELLVGIIGGVLLAKYQVTFLTPRYGGRLLTAVAFVAEYLIIRELFYFFAGDYYAFPALLLPLVVARYAVIFCASLTLFRRDIGKQAFVICSAFAVGGNCANIGWCAQMLIPGDGDILSAPLIGGDTPIAAKIIFIAIFALAFSVSLLLALGSIPKSFAHTRLLPVETLMLILPCVPSILMDNALTVLIENVGLSMWTDFYQSYGIFFLTASVCLLFTVTYSVRLVQKSRLLRIEEKDAAILREQIRELRSRDADGPWAEIRGMRHDMKHHLSNMQFLLQSADAGNPESALELSAYLGKMNETLDQFEFAFQTGNSVTDAVINRQSLKASWSRIRFTSEFIYPPTISVDAYDLAVILQNALENACEACAAVPESERFINVRSRMKAEMFFVEISNSYAGKITFDDTGLPLTSKQDAAEHGLGVSNIRRTAKKHHGDIDITLSKQGDIQIFTLTVALQSRKSQ